MKVLVTGASGCIGTWVLRSLLLRGAEVIVYDIAPSADRWRLVLTDGQIRSLQIETGSIEDTERVKSLVRNSGVTHIVHLAAVLMPFCQANPVKGGLINVIGTLNVFEAARDAGRPVRVVYASSSAVLGPEEFYAGNAVKESDSLQPATFYGIFKNANEETARVFYTLNHVTSVGLRPWAVYGPGRDQGLTADPTLAIRAVSQGVPFRIRLSGFIDLQFVEDVAETFIACLRAPAEGAHVFNLAGTVISMHDLIEEIDAIRPGSAQLLSFDGPQVPVAYRVDDTKLQQSVPDLPKTSLNEGIRRTLEVFDRLQSMKPA